MTLNAAIRTLEYSPRYLNSIISLRPGNLINLVSRRCLFGTTYMEILFMPITKIFLKSVPVLDEVGTWGSAAIRVWKSVQTNVPQVSIGVTAFRNVRNWILMFSSIESQRNWHFDIKWYIIYEPQSRGHNYKRSVTQHFPCPPPFVNPLPYCSRITHSTLGSFKIDTFRFYWPDIVYWLAPPNVSHSQ